MCSFDWGDKKGSSQFPINVDCIFSQEHIPLFKTQGTNISLDSYGDATLFSLINQFLIILRLV